MDIFPFIGKGFFLSTEHTEYTEPFELMLKNFKNLFAVNKNNVSGIVEETDATDAQKQIKIINSGIYCVKKEFLEYSLNKISSNNAQSEFYLTDIIKIGYNYNKNVGAVIGQDNEELLGINSIQDLMAIERIIQKRLGIIA